MDAYRSAQWVAFRDEVIRLDGGACTACYRRAEDGVVLQVHHKRYVPGRKPWEYPHHMCRTLCRGCHAAEHGIIPPAFGWHLVGTDDLGDLIGSCELCGTGIRHVFMVTHPKWRPLEVGTDCCDHLTCTQAASDHMESLRRYQERRKRFVSSPRWTYERNGTTWITQRTQHGHKVRLEVKRVGNTFGLCMYGQLGKQRHASIVGARAVAFDLLEAGDIDRWIERLFRKR